MKRLLLALPVLGLLLQCDRLAVEPPPTPATRAVADVSQVLHVLPARSRGRYGKAGDPLNILFLGSETQVRAALLAAGWSPIPLSIAGSVAEGLAELWHAKTLASFPTMQSYRIDGRAQDMNWAQVITPILARHHFRLWRTGIVDGEGRELWWGSGNLDESVRLWDLSHRPNPDMDLEREHLAETLKSSPLVQRISLVALAQIPRQGSNDNRYAFRDDGRALLVELKP